MKLLMWLIKCHGPTTEAKREQGRVRLPALTSRGMWQKLAGENDFGRPPLKRA